MKALSLSPGIGLTALALGSQLAVGAETITPTNAVLSAFTNSLGMRFVALPGTTLSVSIWETRVRDYRTFAEAVSRPWTKPDYEQTDDHPAVNTNWEDADAFCRWLTQRERQSAAITAAQRYRLPTDLEWNLMVGWGREPEGTPEQRLKRNPVWPWGWQWPPTAGVGNYAPELRTDRFPNTAPVGSFPPNRLGLYDLGGNVWEWCDDWYSQTTIMRVLRGGSFNDSLPGTLLSAYRFHGTMNLVNDDIGFRVVLETKQP